jgi:hypothetical protein
MESKTACAGAGIWSTSKSSLMISRMSRSLGDGLAVTKLPQTKNTTQSSAGGSEFQVGPQPA